MHQKRIRSRDEEKAMFLKMKRHQMSSSSVPKKKGEPKWMKEVRGLDAFSVATTGLHFYELSDSDKATIRKEYEASKKTEKLIEEEAQRNPMNIRSNKELIFGHSLTHKFWNDLQEGKEVKGWNKESVRKEHARLVKIMLKRGIKHNSPLSLSNSKKSKQSKPYPEPLKIVPLNRTKRCSNCGRKFKDEDYIKAGRKCPYCGSKSYSVRWSDIDD